MKKYRYEILENGEITDRITCDSKQELIKWINVITKENPRFNQEIKTEETQGEREARQAKEPITEKQAKFLKEVLGYEGDLTHSSKLEANKLIQELKKNQDTIYY